MSLTLITALTTLRVAIGATGVIYSFFQNKDDHQNFDFGKVPEAIFGQVVGGVFYDWLKDGASIGYDRLTAKLDSLDPDAHYHDLQRAARKSVLLATFIACEGCLANLNSERKTIPHKLKNIVWKDEDINWLIVVTGELKNEIDNLDKATFEKDIKYSQLFDIFDKNNIANTETAQKEYAGKLRAETLKDIKNNYYSKFGKTKTVELSDNGLTLLSEAMEIGWKKFDEDRTTIVQLRLTENGRNVKEYNWFKLVCLLFNEEYKVSEKLEAAFQRQNALDQTTILKDIQEKLSNFGRIENYSEIEHQLSEFRGENFRQHETTHSKLDEISFKFDDLKEMIRGQLSPTNQPVPVHNLPPLTDRVYGRETEKTRVVAALKSGVKKFSLIVAPSGFGKTRLLAKVLQDYTDIEGRTIKPQVANEIDRLMLIDCRLVQNLSDITRELNTVLGTQLIFENKEKIYNEAWLKLVFEMIAGKTWLFLDNFEAWLTADYQLINPEIRSFLNVLLIENHGFRGIALSQSEPEAGLLNNFELLRDVGADISKGLDKKSAIEYLRDNADDSGLDTAPEDLIVQFLKEVHYIPQALNSLTGYLKSISGYTFAEFMDKQNGFWSQFDEHEQDETDLDKGIRRTKALIKQQILKQSDDVQMLMKILSFFTRSVPREALEIFFESKAESAKPISRLTSHNLAVVSLDRQNTKYYELHAYFRDQSLKWLNKLEDISPENLEQIAGLLLTLGNESYKYNFFNRCFALLELSEQILQLDSQISSKNHLAGTYMNKGIALDILGKLNEAIDQYDKAIAIFDDLVNVQKREDLANHLAAAYINKGVALRNLGKLNETIDQYNKAIATLEELVNVQKREDLANNLANAYVNKGVALYSFGRLNEAIDQYNKAIATLEELVNVQKREDLTNDLAATYMNKGLALEFISDIENAMNFFNYGIDWRERCLARGEHHVLPDYVKDLAHRTRILIKSEKWQLAADDILNIFGYFSFFENPEVPDYFKRRIGNEIFKTVKLVKNISLENKENLYKFLGDEYIDFIENFDEYFRKESEN